MGERARQRTHAEVLEQGERIERMRADGVEPEAIRDRLCLTERQVRHAVKVWRAHLAEQS